MTKNYITDAIKESGFTKEDLFNDNHYSIIAGGVGTGKSTFICRSLAKVISCKPEEILLVVPLTAIVNQLINKGEVANKDLDQDFYTMDKITACTFNKLKSIIINREALPTQIKYVIFDEAHNLITAEQFAKYGSFFIKWFEDNDIQVLFLTATPAALTTYKHAKKPFRVITAVKSNLKVGNIIFTTESDLLSHVKYFSKIRTFIAVQSVKEAQKLEKQLNEKLPGSAVALFSRYHDKATKNMIEIADEVIKTEKFPEKIKFLIVNAAYIEGMEIQTKVETAIVKQPTVTAIVQAVGRLRQGVNDVVVVLSKDHYFENTKRLFDEFEKFLVEYREADVLIKLEMLLGMYSVQKERFGHEFVSIHSMIGYVPNYQINMPLYHSLEIQLQDSKRLFCEDEISDKQFRNLINMFEPYFPDAQFIRLNHEGMTSKEEKFRGELCEFLADLIGERVYTQEHMNGISIDKVCRKVMQLRESHHIMNVKPVKCTRTLINELKQYGYDLSNKSSERVGGGKVGYRRMICTQKMDR